ncbi:MAG TPA: serine dehydratase [Bacteroidales bacterium]|nr:serine dehydratase [Bacteroidales bacterium]
MNSTATSQGVKDAMLRISEYVHRTPVLSSESINHLTGCNLVFKCENFQKVGAFKYRGATNAVLTLSANELQLGVITHSSGNHAAALALAAKKAGTKAYIVMPNNAPEIKKLAVEGYGGIITFCEPNQAAREKTANEIIDKTGATFVHPYNNKFVIEGQGTAAFEMLETLGYLPDFILAPTGGGGLTSGTILAALNFGTSIKIIGTEPSLAGDAKISMNTGIIQPAFPQQSIADGLLTSLGSMTFEIMQNHISEVLNCSEESIIAAMRMVWERMKIIIEPSSAVPLACVLENRSKFENKTVAIIISGGNVALNKLPF